MHCSPVVMWMGMCYCPCMRGFVCDFIYASECVVVCAFFVFVNIWVGVSSFMNIYTLVRIFMYISK